MSKITMTDLLTYQRKKRLRAAAPKLKKRKLKQKVTITAVKPLAFVRVFLFHCAEEHGMVTAFTTGEARAKIKQRLGLTSRDRLPKDCKVWEA